MVREMKNRRTITTNVSTLCTEENERKIKNSIRTTEIAPKTRTGHKTKCSNIWSARMHTRTKSKEKTPPKIKWNTNLKTYIFCCEISSRVATGSIIVSSDCGHCSTSLRSTFIIIITHIIASTAFPLLHTRSPYFVAVCSLLDIFLSFCFVPLILNWAKKSGLHISSIEQ